MSRLAHEDILEWLQGHGLDPTEIHSISMGLQEAKIGAMTAHKKVYEDDGRIAVKDNELVTEEVVVPLHWLPGSPVEQILIWSSTNGSTSWDRVGSDT